MLSNGAVQKIFETLLARTRFFYSYSQVFEYLAKCLCIKRFNLHRKNKKNKRHFYYKKADKKLGQEMDILNLIRSIRKLKMMAKIIDLIKVVAQTRI